MALMCARLLLNRCTVRSCINIFCSGGARLQVDAYALYFHKTFAHDKPLIRQK